MKINIIKIKVITKTVKKLELVSLEIRFYSFSFFTRSYSIHYSVHFSINQSVDEYIH